MPPPAPVWVPSRKSLAPSVTSVTSGPNYMIIIKLTLGLCTYLLAFALSWGKSQKTSARRPSDEETVRPVIASNGVLFLQMRSVESHSTLRREKEGKDFWAAHQYHEHMVVSHRILTNSEWYEGQTKWINEILCTMEWKEIFSVSYWGIKYKNWVNHEKKRRILTLFYTDTILSYRNWTLNHHGYSQLKVRMTRTFTRYDWSLKGIPSLRFNSPQRPYF